MSRAWKFAGAAAAVLVVVALGGFGYVEATYERDYSDVPEPGIRASDDPAVIERGEYVVHALAHCSACHGPESREGHELGPMTDLSGGYAMEAGPFGTFYPSNLSSDEETGIGAVSDGALARAIRHGVARDGRFAPFMRIAVGPMADEDLQAVISYLRTLPAIENEVPRDRWGFIAKLIAGKFEPRDGAAPEYVPGGEISVERGEYLANGPAGCIVCHTQTDPMQGFAFVGEPFSGVTVAEPDAANEGYEFAAPNLTPDPETGIITGWSEDEFVARFDAGRVYAGSVMPWENFAQMTEEDRRSIYRYLRALPPVHNNTGPSWREKGWTAEEDG